MFAKRTGGFPLPRVLDLQVALGTDRRLAASRRVDVIVVEETDWTLLFEAGDTVVFAVEPSGEFMVFD